MGESAVPLTGSQATGGQTEEDDNPTTSLLPPPLSGGVHAILPSDPAPGSGALQLATKVCGACHQLSVLFLALRPALLPPSQAHFPLFLQPSMPGGCAGTQDV